MLPHHQSERPPDPLRLELAILLRSNVIGGVSRPCGRIRGQPVCVLTTVHGRMMMIVPVHNTHLIMASVSLDRQNFTFQVDVEMHTLQLSRR